MKGGVKGHGSPPGKLFEHQAHRSENTAIMEEEIAPTEVDSDNNSITTTEPEPNSITTTEPEPDVASEEVFSHLSCVLSRCPPPLLQIWGFG